MAEPSPQEVSGLWAELWVIARSGFVARALEVWREDSFERFDFSWEFSCAEVKSTVFSQRVHEFSLEQLRIPVDGRGFIVSLLLQPIAGGVSVLELVDEIEGALKNMPELRKKLWRNVTKSLGKEFSDKLDKRFDPSFAERNLTIFDMSDVPKIEPPYDPRISSVRFSVDLSAVESSMKGSSLSRLEFIFGAIPNR
jgi:hypothetical protein